MATALPSERVAILRTVSPKARRIRKALSSLSLDEKRKPVQLSLRDCSRNRLCRTGNCLPLVRAEFDAMNFRCSMWHKV